MKWNEAAIILLDPIDSAITRAAGAWRDRYRIPPERTFSVPYPTGGRQAARVPPGCTALEPDSLSFSGLGTKLIVVSHGHRDGLVMGRSMLGGDKVAELLAGWGLREVGLLAFKGCWLGKSASGCWFWKRSFLDRLLDRLSYRNVGVGWLIGYKDVSRTGIRYVDSPTAGMHAHGYESIGWADYLLRSESKGQLKLDDDQRVKIVRGNRLALPRVGAARRYYAPGTIG